MHEIRFEYGNKWNICIYNSCKKGMYVEQSYTKVLD